MSNTSNVFILSSDSWFNSLTQVARLNQWILDYDLPGQAGRIEALGNDQTKVMQISIFAGTLQQLEQEGFIECYQNLDWPGTLLVIASEAKEDGYKIIASKGDQTRIDVRLAKIARMFGGSHITVEQYAPEEEQADWTDLGNFLNY